MSNKARRTLPKFSLELASVVGGPHAPTASALIVSRPSAANDAHALTTSSATSSSSSAGRVSYIKEEQLVAVGREAGLPASVASTLATVCAFIPLQEAFLKSVEASSEGMSPVESVVSSIKKGYLPGSSDSFGQRGGKGKEREGSHDSADTVNDDDSDPPTSLRDYDHYKLKAHSFNEYRSEQDITGLLLVDEDGDGVPRPAGGDDWCQTSLGARGLSRSVDDGHYYGGEGHAGEPGYEGQEFMKAVMLMLTVVTLSLGFLHANNRQDLFRIAIQSELVKGAVALGTKYADTLCQGLF